MATKPSGIAGLNTNTRTYLDTLAGLRAKEAQRSIQPSPDMNVVRQRQAEYANYLGQTDYAKQLEESQNMGKLQLALALAQRGFAAAGATPKRGESSIGTLSRELLSPLAGDAGSVAGRMMQQKQAINAAKTAEERQLKLAALQKVEAENTQLGDLAYKLMSKPKTSDMKQGNRGYARQIGDNGKPTGPVVPLQYTFDGENYQARTVGEGTQTSVTLGGKNPTHIVTNEKGEALGAAGTKADTRKLQAGEFNLVKTDGSVFTVTQGGKTRTPVYRAIVDGADRGKLVDLGSGDVFSREDLKKKGLSPRKLMAGTAATPKGLESPDFKATLAGYLSNLGGQQDRLGLGKFGIKFVPSNYDPAKSLDPNQTNYPFARVDGQALTLAEKTKFTSQITSGYFNALKALKGGQNLLNINKAFSEKFFKQNVKQLGLSPASAGAAPNPFAAQTEAAVTAFYKRAPVLFQQQGDVGEVLKGIPVPVRGQNFTSGIGKLKLSFLTGVSFGTETNSPPPTAFGEDVTIRATNVKGMDRGNIQRRKIAENLAKGTSYAGKLSQSATPRLDDQLQVVSKALADKTAALEKRQNDPASVQAAQLFSGALDAVARLDRMSVAAELSGVQGIIRGPAIAAGIKYLGTDFLAWFKSTREQGATSDFVAGLPVLRQLFGRALVKAAEGTSARISNQDLKGVQTALASLNENKDFSRDKVKELRRYLVSTIKNTATQLGNFVVPDATLEEAARLGIDLKAIQGKEGYYNPYLNNGKYAVSKGQIPELSKEYQDSLRTQGLFNYLSDGNEKPMYKMIKAKEDNQGTFQPVYVKDDNGRNTDQVDYVSLSKKDLTDPEFAGIVNFNKNWLRKTYSLGN